MKFEGESTSNVTTFIIGAGASVPYGLPSGILLLKMILEMLEEIKRDSNYINNYTSIFSGGGEKESSKVLIKISSKRILSDFQSQYNINEIINNILLSYRKGNSVVTSVDTLINLNSLTNESKTFLKILVYNIIAHYEEKYSNRPASEMITSDWIRKFLNEYCTSGRIENYKFIIFNYDRRACPSFS